MKPKIRWMIGSAVFAALAQAQAPQNELPPLPPMQSGENLPFNPTNPLQSSPPIQPIEPLTNGNTSSDTAQMPALPDLQNPEDFEFFQPGAQIGDLQLPAPEPIQPEAEERAGEPTEPAQARKPRRPHKRPLRRRFNYKIQQLPQVIYRKDYSGENRHLPTAQYEHDYDHATFIAAARNDVNGLRAMLRHGGRTPQMRNTQGETLVEVAMRHQAHEALRYLLAIGAPHGGVQPVDRLSAYALRAAP